MQGALVMREAKGRKGRSNKSLGVASYAGRQGRSHFFRVEFDDGSSELLTVPQLRARLTAAPKRQARANVTVNQSLTHGASQFQSVVSDLSQADNVRSLLRTGMPGVHDAVKVGAIVMAASAGSIQADSATIAEVQQLGSVISLAEAGTVFLPWRWPTDAVEQLRDFGCALRTSRDEGSLHPIQHPSFVEAQSAGVRMGVIGFSVDEALSDLVLPVACEFAESVVVSRVPPTYITMADPARLSWLRGLHRQGRLALIQCPTCVWVVVFATAQLQHALRRVPSMNLDLL